MQWLSNHFWLLFGGVGGTTLVGLIGWLLSRFFKEPAENTDATVTVQDSQVTDSPIASGFQVTQNIHYEQPLAPHGFDPVVDMLRHKRAMTLNRPKIQGEITRGFVQMFMPWETHKGAVHARCFTLKVRLENHGLLETTLRNYRIKIEMNNREFESEEVLKLVGKKLLVMDENNQTEPLTDLVIDHVHPIKRGIDRTGWLRFRVDGFKDLGQLERTATMTLFAKDGLGKEHSIGPCRVVLTYGQLGQAG